MTEKRYSRLQLFLSALAGAAAALVALAAVLWVALGPQTLCLVEAWGVIRTQFIGEYDGDQVMDAALNGMVAGTEDRWSYYLDAESYQAQNQRRNNAYVGIGVTVDYSDERGLYILQVTPGAPAEAAGLTAGEVITAVDGFSLAGENRSEGSDRIMGEAGTTVSLTLLSADGEERTVEVVRAEVENTSVTWELLSDGTGYVAVSNFYTHSGDQLKAAVDALVEQGAEALVFDMRNNGGGYVTELTAMLDYLLPEGPIFRSEGRSGKETVTQSDGACVELPMATLVNANTYSAAEFFAAQLQESVGAAIVGEPTSGKGYSQQAIPLINGGAFNLSTARYRTGAGVSLIGTGVTLDREVVLSGEDALALQAGMLAREADLQLQAALELLKEK